MRQDQSYYLKPKQSASYDFFFMMFFSLIWNASVIAAFYLLIAESMHIAITIGVGLFLTPFALIGLITCLFWGKACMNLFSPRIKLTLEPKPVKIGESATLTWKFNRSVRKMSELTVILEAVETPPWKKKMSVADKQKGLDKQSSYNKPIVQLFNTDKASNITQADSIQFEIPYEDVPELKNKHYSIKWSLKVHYATPWWVNTDETYEFTVTSGEE